ncbi:MAG: prolipoprotein diacylglyceryl transferase [Pseudomonadota bacterium]
MRPVLFHLGSLDVPSFFLAVTVGALLATFFGARVARKEGADEIAMLDFGIIAIIAGVIGARIFHIMVEEPMYYIDKPIRVFYFWQGGFVSLGAYIASLTGWLIYMKVKGLEKWRYLDIAVTAVPIIIFFVRIGCLLAGCCWGKPCDLPWAITFHNASSVVYSKVNNLPVHPTQVYNMINALIMWGVVWFSYKHRKFYGQVLCTFFIYYGITRFFIEFLRGDADRGLYFNNMVSTGQIVMILSFLTGIVLWLILRKKEKIFVL